MAGLVTSAASLESRVRAIEDREAIVDLIASYGPGADSGDGEAIAALWTEDGTYQFDDVIVERSEIAGILSLDSHRDYMQSGCAHILSPPRVQLDGDRAEAINHSIVLVKRGETWVAERVSANRWELGRTTAGWRVVKRTNRLLNGQASAQALLTAF